MPREFDAVVRDLAALAARCFGFAAPVVAPSADVVTVSFDAERGVLRWSPAWVAQLFTRLDGATASAVLLGTIAPKLVPEDEDDGDDVPKHADLFAAAGVFVLVGVPAHTVEAATPALAGTGPDAFVRARILREAYERHSRERKPGRRRRRRP
jgi:hypothetical protein